MFKYVFLGLAMVAASACSEAPQPAAAEAEQKPGNTLMRVISGEVMYRERMLLPPGAEVIVILEDQSRMDVAATEITSYTHIADGGPPYPFRLVFDPRVIDDRMRYGVRARIEHQGKLMFTSTEHIDPFAATEGEKLKVMVSRTGG